MTVTGTVCGGAEGRGVIAVVGAPSSYARHPEKSALKKCVVLQVNDAAVRIRLVVFGSKVQRFYTQITEQTGWGRGERRRVPPL